MNLPLVLCSVAGFTDISAPQISAHARVLVAVPVLRGTSAESFQGGNAGPGGGACFCQISFPPAKCDKTAQPRFWPVNPSMTSGPSSFFQSWSDTWRDNWKRCRQGCTYDASVKEMENTWHDRINKDSLTAVKINGLWEELDIQPLIFPGTLHK